ncbi:MAG: enhanced intracellular survival protein Eis [Clostridia bacterium]
MQVKPVLGNNHLKEYARISALAYPGFDTTPDKLFERLQELNKDDPDSIFYVCEDQDKILGGMRVIDYVMNYNSQFIKISGIGMVAVDLTAKKRGVAKTLLLDYLNISNKNGQYIAILYPFRPDFYYRMGFGYGPKYYNYSFKPTSLNKLEDYDSITYLNGDDLTLIADCYLRYTKQQHGFCERSSFELKQFRKKFLKEGTIIGYKKNGYIDGYLYFVSKKVNEENFLRHKLIIKEWIYNSPEAFRALSGFLNIQKDQYDYIEYETQKDNFYFAFSDVRRSDLEISHNIAHRVAYSGIGLMYRVVNVEMFIKKVLSEIEINCPELEILLALEDSFMPMNQKVYKLLIRDRRVTLVDNLINPIQINMNIAEFSSLIIGSAKLRNLYQIGKVKCNKKDIESLECFFDFASSPECITKF